MQINTFIARHSDITKGDKPTQTSTKKTSSLRCLVRPMSVFAGLSVLAKGTSFLSVTDD